MDFLPRISDAPESAFFLIVFLGIILASIRQLEPGRLRLFIRAFFNANLVDQQIRQERSFNRLAVLVFAFIIGTISTFAALALHHYHYFTEINLMGLVAMVLVAVLVITTVRVATYSLVAWLSELEALQQVQTFHWLLVNFILALSLLPLSAIYSYGPTGWRSAVMTTGLTMFALSYTIRAVRIFYIASESFRVPLLYNFLYFCALEILPPLLALATIQQQAGL